MLFGVTHTLPFAAAQPMKLSPAASSKRVNPTPQKKPASSAKKFTPSAETVPSPVKVSACKEITFYHKPDMTSRFLTLKQTYQKNLQKERLQAVDALQVTNPNKLDIAALRPLAQQAFDEAETEIPFQTGQQFNTGNQTNTKSLTQPTPQPTPQWAYHSGQAPLLFYAKAHIRNPGREALLEENAWVAYSVKTGPYRVRPGVFITDYAALNHSAKWVSWLNTTVSIPALAPQQEKLISLPPFELLAFLAKYPQQWPIAVNVRVGFYGETCQATIPLYPDHFGLFPITW